MENTIPNPSTPNTPTNTPSAPAAEPQPQVVTGTVQSATTTKELSGGAQAGIGITIGTCNICCAPMCYGCPTILTSIVGIVLYFVWKQEKPQSAKNILMVTLITAAIGFVILGIFFALGFASSIMDSMSSGSYYSY